MNDDVMSLSSKAGYIVGDVVAEERHCHLATDFLADHSKENVFGLRNYADPNSDQKGEKKSEKSGRHTYNGVGDGQRCHFPGRKLLKRILPSTKLGVDS